MSANVSNGRNAALANGLNAISANDQLFSNHAANNQKRTCRLMANGEIVLFTITIWLQLGNGWLKSVNIISGYSMAYES